MYKLDLKTVEEIVKFAQAEKIPFEFIKDARVITVDGKTVRLQYAELKEILQKQMMGQEKIIADINDINLNYKLIKKIMEQTTDEILSVLDQ